MQDAEERLLAALQDKAGAKRLGELRKVLLSKEQKMRALREALVKLKQVWIVGVLSVGTPTETKRVESEEFMYMWIKSKSSQIMPSMGMIDDIEYSRDDI